MALADLSLRSPWGLLLCAIALVPLSAVALGFARQRRVAQAIGLEPARGRRAARVAALPVCACLLVGVAAARPVLTTTERKTARTESEVVFVTDVSLSMLAAPRAGAPTRLDRARTVVQQLRSAVPDVPAGVSGLTDRALPYLFPTLDAGVFADTLKRSVLPDAPQPQGIGPGGVATNLQPLGVLGRNGFFSPSARHRTCVLVTDGETRAVLPAPRGCTLIVIRVGGPGDRIFGRNGKVDASYRPESSAASTVDRLARAAGGTPYTEGQLAAATAALRKAAEVGPRKPVGTGTTVHALAPYLAAFALAVVAMVVLRRYLRPAGGVSPSRRRRREGAAVEV
jgi:hypothetical protein